ncbi:MAG: glycosyl transferase group 1 [Chloroflexi bacterium]|nr:glycosyl transferase group 1 [Chloroflexota bacterium]
MRILYVNHTGNMSGAELSLLDLLRGLPRDVEAVVACPPGPLARAVSALDLCVLPIRGTDASLRLHPVQTTVGLLHMASGARSISRRARRRPHVDIVHANSVRAGLVAALALPGARAPLIVHVRDCLPDTSVARLSSRLLRGRAATIVANSRYTAERFSGGGHGRIRWVHNAVDLRRFTPHTLPRDQARDRLLIKPDVDLLAVIGQITPWKGQDDAIRILAKLRPQHPRAHLLLVGEPRFVHRSTRYDNRTYEEHLHALSKELGVTESVTFMGHRDDVATVMRAANVVLVPSWEEPFGRSVIEAMAMETPVAATDIGGPAEIISNGVDGLLLPPRNPDAWVGALSELLSDRSRQQEMGRLSRLRVESAFALDQHVTAMLDVYREALVTTGGGQGPSKALQDARCLRDVASSTER